MSLPGFFVCDDCSVLLGRITSKRDINQSCVSCNAKAGEFCTGAEECPA
jgi:hypothetical protein